MIHLIWGLLNFGLFIFFIVICFDATKLIRKNNGTFASVIFVIGLISILGNSNNKEETKTWSFISEKSLKLNETSTLKVDLEKTLLSKKHLVIKYGIDKEKEINTPISANSSTVGFISGGIKWKPISVVVNKTNYNNKFEYFVSGVVEWKLIGITIYSQYKVFNGIALIK